MRQTGPKYAKNGDFTLYFTCNRNGIYETCTKSLLGRARELKSTGTKKIKCTCPASMTVVVNAEGYHVTYVSTHDGHLNDICHLTLTKNERRSLAGNFIWFIF